VLRPGGERWVVGDTRVLVCYGAVTLYCDCCEKEASFASELAASASSFLRRSVHTRACGTTCESHVTLLESALGMAVLPGVRQERTLSVRCTNATHSKKSCVERGLVPVAGSTGILYPYMADLGPPPLPRPARHSVAPLGEEKKKSSVFRVSDGHNPSRTISPARASCTQVLDESGGAHVG
jgi:hypothetical protein